MPFLNIEIKARCKFPDKVRDFLVANEADFSGLDLQVDTYFNVPKGRLKLREGTIEKALIYYERVDQEGPKQADGHVFELESTTAMKALLINALGIRIVVDKKREIYFINNVKFHIDSVDGLGNFVEIEAQDHDGTRDKAELMEQCRYWLRQMRISEIDLIDRSYSDLMGE